MENYKTDAYYYWAEPKYIGPFDTLDELITHFEAECERVGVSEDEMRELGYPVSMGYELNELDEPNN